MHVAPRSSSAASMSRHGSSSLLPLFVRQSTDMDMMRPRTTTAGHKAHPIHKSNSKATLESHSITDFVRGGSFGEKANELAEAIKSRREERLTKSTNSADKNSQVYTGWASPIGLPYRPLQGKRDFMALRDRMIQDGTRYTPMETDVENNVQNQEEALSGKRVEGKVSNGAWREYQIEVKSEQLQLVIHFWPQQGSPTLFVSTMGPVSKGFPAQWRSVGAEYDTITISKKDPMFVVGSYHMSVTTTKHAATFVINAQTELCRDFLKPDFGLEDNGRRTRGKLKKAVRASMTRVKACKAGSRFEDAMYNNMQQDGLVHLRIKDIPKDIRDAATMVQIESIGNEADEIHYIKEGDVHHAAHAHHPNDPYVKSKDIHHHHHHPHHHHSKHAESHKSLDSQLTDIAKLMESSFKAGAASTSKDRDDHQPKEKSRFRKILPDKKTSTKTKKAERVASLESIFEAVGLPLVFAEALQYLEDEGDANKSGVPSIAASIDNAGLLYAHLALDRAMPAPYTVSFVDYPNLTSHILDFMCGRSSYIRRLVLDGCVHFSLDSLLHLLQTMTKLRSLSLAGCTQFTDKDISESAPFFGRIRKLSLAECHVGDNALMQIIAHCSSLVILNLSATSITDKSLSLIEDESAGCVKVQEMTLSHCRGVTNKGLMSLATLPELYLLDVSGCRGVTADGIAAIMNSCKRLNDIRLALCSHVTDEALTKIARKRPSLERLDILSSTDVTKNGVDEISRHCKELKSLSLARCSNVDQEAIMRLAIRCSRLTSLNLSHCPAVNDDCVMMIADSLRGLVSLNLNGCSSVSADAIAAVILSGSNLINLEFTAISRLTTTDRDLLARLAAEHGNVQLVY